MRASSRAHTRYFTTAHLRKQLTHDPALGGTPVRFLRARWLLEHFQAAGNEAERLEHRQALERVHGDAPFVSGAMLERALTELESGHYEGIKSAQAPWAEAGFPIRCSHCLTAMSQMCATHAAAHVPVLMHPCVHGH